MLSVSDQVHLPFWLIWPFRITVMANSLLAMIYTKFEKLAVTVYHKAEPIVQQPLTLAVWSSSRLEFSTDYAFIGLLRQQRLGHRREQVPRCLFRQV